jgi:biotin-independent malonate decarboxylase gamma subunit
LLWRRRADRRLLLGFGGLRAGTHRRSEVIETNRSVEEFDSRDRALVWRTMGGKHRRLIGVRNHAGVLMGSATLKTGRRALVAGVTDRTALGVDGALRLARHVLESVDQDDGPIVVVVDSGSQRMSKRDELLGLNEFLAHVAKTLLYADLHGRPTVGVLYGHSAAGAFLATALATRVLVAIPGAEPAVMDLASMSRVTKLPIEVLADRGARGEGEVDTGVCAGPRESCPHRGGP